MNSASRSYAVSSNWSQNNVFGGHNCPNNSTYLIYSIHRFDFAYCRTDSISTYFADLDNRCQH